MLALSTRHEADPLAGFFRMPDRADRPKFGERYSRDTSRETRHGGCEGPVLGMDRYHPE